MKGFLAGIFFVEALLIGLYFLKFWLRSRDRLFLIFAGAFGLLSLDRLLLQVANPPRESAGAFFLMRLLAFLLIIWAIVDKNRRIKPSPPAGPEDA